MPTFVVEFDRPVTYLKGHPRGERQITTLPVHAPDGNAARDHAVRVTRGGAAVLSVIEVPKGA